jgi:hypothetical protein
MLDEALAEACARFGCGEGLGVAFVAPQAVDQRLRLGEQSIHSLRPAAAHEIVRVWPAGSSTKRSVRSGARKGKAREAARIAAV